MEANTVGPVTWCVRNADRVATASSAEGTGATENQASVCDGDVVRQNTSSTTQASQLARSAACRAVTEVVRHHAWHYLRHQAHRLRPTCLALNAEAARA